MKRLTVSLRPEHVEEAERRVEEGEAESKSEAIRQMIDEADRAESLEHDLEVAEARLEDQGETLAAPFFVRWYRYFRGDRDESE